MGVTTRPTARDGRAPRQPSRLVGWGLVLALVALVVAGVAAGVLRQPAVLDPASPDGTVQAYVQAVLDGDWDRARSHVDDGLAARCTVLDFRHSWVPDGLTAVLADVRLDDDCAEVEVRLRTTAQPGLFDTGYRTTETFDLVRTGTTWHITGQPWPVYDCRGW